MVLKEVMKKKIRQAFLVLIAVMGCLECKVTKEGLRLPTSDIRREDPKPEETGRWSKGRGECKAFRAWAGTSLLPFGAHLLCNGSHGSQWELGVRSPRIYSCACLWPERDRHASQQLGCSEVIATVKPSRGNSSGNLGRSICVCLGESREASQVRQSRCGNLRDE